jgi:hypothetical protein
MYGAAPSDEPPAPICACFELDCPIHVEEYGGHPDFRCENYSEVVLLRIDRINQDDKTGTPVCEECAEWLKDTGKFEGKRGSRKLISRQDS